jgi:hypothetical protein
MTVHKPATIMSREASAQAAVQQPKMAQDRAQSAQSCEFYCGKAEHFRAAMCSKQMISR